MNLMLSKFAKLKLQLHQMKPTFQMIWKASRKDLLIGIPFIPLYSLSAIAMALSTVSLLQLIFINKPRVPVLELIPGNLKNFFTFHQILDREDLFFIVPFALVLFGFLKLIGSFFSNYFIERAGHKSVYVFRHQILEKFLASSGNILDRKNLDEYCNQLMQDTLLLQNSISKSTFGSIRDFLVIILSFISMLLISFESFLISIIVGIPVLILIQRVAKKIAFFTRESQIKQVALATKMLQIKNGFLTISALRTQKRELSHLSQFTDSFYKFMQKSLLVRTSFAPSLELFAIIVLVVTLIIKYKMPSFHAGIYSALLILLAFAFRSLKNIANVLNQINEIAFTFQRVTKNLNEFKTVEIQNTSYFKDLAQSGSAFSLENISLYAENSNKVILDNINLEIPKGVLCAFVGESGAGKTTLLRILAGLVFPDKGKVKYQGNLLLAPQHPYIFKGTVEENILYAKEKRRHHEPSLVRGLASSEWETSDKKAVELVLALALAFSESGAKLFLQKNVGYSGEGLSGGEKARVALARSLICSPDILLLDEPTANLDSESALSFWKSVRQWKNEKAGRTVIAISHVMSDVKEFDLCFKFSQGRLTWQGHPSKADL